MGMKTNRPNAHTQTHLYAAFLLTGHRTKNPSNDYRYRQLDRN